MADEPKLRSPIIQFLKHLLCDVWLDIVLEKNWALSIDQCQVQALQFSVHLIDLLSILLRCNGFTGIQKAVVDHSSSRSPNSDHDLFWCKFGFMKCFELLLSPAIELVGHCWLSYTLHFKKKCLFLIER